MKITITRSFERTRQIADFVPIKAYCEATIEYERGEQNQILNVPNEQDREYSFLLDSFVQAEVEKTLISYRPVCIVCRGKGDTVILNKEGVCGHCVKTMQFQAAEFRADADKKRNETKPPATGK
jgi:hypothetical protein